MMSDVNFIGTGKVAFKYNYFHNISCRILNTGSISTGVLEYNYLEMIGATGGCHGETVEYNTSSTVYTHLESYNVYYLPTQANPNLDTSFAYVQSAKPGPAGPGKMINATVNNNVMITRPSTKADSNGNHVPLAAPLWVDTSFDNSISKLVMQNNYIDPAGSYFAIHLNSGGSYPGWIGSSACNNNYRLSSSGASLLKTTMGSGASVISCK